MHTQQRSWQKDRLSTSWRSRCRHSRRHTPPIRCAIVAKQAVTADAVVVGAGIIGLLTAHALLKKGLTVALVERKQLCAGATGAGQGYIWMAHRSPCTAAWDLASTSVVQWKQMVQENPQLRSCIEWQDTGSMLLATQPEEAEALRQRQALLLQHGVASTFLGPDRLHEAEPALAGSSGAASPAGSLGIQGALIAAGDAQINGRQTAHHLLSCCQRFPGLMLMLEEPVDRLLLQPSGDCPTGVETQSRIISSRFGTIVAAGVWSGELLSQATGQPHWSKLLQPRRGHLLEVARPKGMPPLRHGVMEMSYTKHYSTQHPDEQQPGVDITFTATTSASGSLLIGSSREFSGWEAEPSAAIVQAIMERAALFLPDLQGAPLPGGPDVRVGLRPFSTRGAPLIGPVPGFPGLHLAAGHEGSGLCLGPATAQLLCQYMSLQPELGVAFQGPELELSRFSELLPH